MTVVKAVFDSGAGKRRAYELKPLSQSEFDKAKGAAPAAWKSMPIYWLEGSSPVEIWPQNDLAQVEVDGKIQ